MEGVPRLGIPGINMADSAVGVRLAAQGSHYATLLPSVLGAACSWDKDALFLFGSVIGRELRDMGYNMSIGGGVDLARDPRNGRNFEYAGEDPLWPEPWSVNWPKACSPIRSWATSSTTP